MQLCIIKTGDRKMTNTEGFTEVSGSLVFQNPALWFKSEASGVMVKGIYLGRTEKDKYGKSNFKFQATAAGSAISKDLNEVDYAAGTTVIINESGNLDYRLRGTKEGDELTVIYEGKTPMKSGVYKGTLANNFQVLKKAA